MNVAIVGSRNFPNLDWVDDFVKRLPQECLVVTGGARGIDKRAERAADAYGIHYAVIPALWEHYGKPAGFKRNQWICKLADVVVAFWDSSSPGTRHTIELATRHEKPLYVITPGANAKLIDAVAFIKAANAQKEQTP